MYFGGDYNPEQWDESVWEEDVRLMREAGVNLVSVAVFAWAHLQPTEDEYDFAWLDRLLDLLAANGIGANLATATASPPPWFAQRYPDALPVTADGVRLGIGSRQHYAATSPDYRRLAGALVARLAHRYARHPAVRMWHVNNEYANHVRADYSDNAAHAFRAWLQRRYETIDGLNAAWGTAFWAQRYADFTEVALPRTAPTTINPSQMLDFRRFNSESVLDLYRMERDLIRAAGAKQPITTNFMGAFPDLDYWAWAAEVDVIADDCYPDPHDASSFREAAFTRDLMRSLRPGQPWMLMEQAPGAVQWRPSNGAKRPGQMAAWSEQAIARGADAIMFFQWRQSTAGQEKFHSAMLPHSGLRSRTWKEVVALGSALRDRPSPQPIRGDVAIVFDWENWWALRQPDLPADVDYYEETLRWYEALHRRNVQVSFVRAGDDLSAYALVIAPALYLLTGEGAQSLREFVRTGGILLSTAFLDVVDHNDHFRPDGYTTQLREVVGGSPLDYAGTVPSSAHRIRPGGFAPAVMVEDFVLDDGVALATYDDGSPAFVRNEYGRGASLHLTSFARDGYLEWALGRALETAGVEPVLAATPAEVEAIAGVGYVTLINHADHALEVPFAGDTVRLQAYAVTHLPRA